MKKMREVKIMYDEILQIIDAQGNHPATTRELLVDCNQRGLVNLLIPLNLYGLSLLKMDSFVQGRSLVSCILQQSFPLGVPLHILQSGTRR